MKNIIIKKLLFISLIVAFGCDDEEFVTERPETFLTTDNVFTSGTQVEQLVLTMYQQDRNLISNINTDVGRIMYGQGTDVLTVPGFRENTNFADYNTIVTPLAGRFAALYQELYEQISRANLALSLAEGGELSFDTEESRLSVIAQAKFFRGKAHGQAAEFFGNVTIVDEPTTTVRLDFQQNTRAEIYQFAIDDMIAALPDLPETTIESGRVVKGAAQHYISEFYLGLGAETGDAGAYQQAVDFASEVIDGGTYQLMTERFGTRADVEGRTVYWDLFRLGNQNYAEGNLESVWTHQIDFGAFLAGDGGSNLPYPRFFSPVLRAIPGFVGEDANAGGRGVAFVRQTELTESIIWDPSISDGDMRNDESNIRRRVFYNNPEFLGGALVGQEIPQDTLDEANANGLRDGAYYGIYEKLTSDLLIVDQGQNGSNLFRDRYVIRLPETILLRAEAHFRLGDNQAAADDINLIRDRAQANIRATAGMIDLDFILDERARELFGEENRWATLLRMGGTVAVDRIREFAFFDFTRSSLTFDFNTFPIPQTVIDRNSGNVLTQNPGWQGR